jgi:uncharacterized protein YbbK (DUF523 family)
MQKPIVIISACLEFEKVRYNGQSMPSKIIRDLEPFVRFVKVCPEFEIGLGVPREPIRIVKRGNELRLIQHQTDRDITDEMNGFAAGFIKRLKAADGFIFKSKSPSMGLGNIKVYAGMKGAPVVGRCGGFFASRILENYRGYPIEEEDRLRNKKIRDHFLTELFLFARYRIALGRNKLKEFNDNNRLLFEFYDKNSAKKLDPDKSNYFESIKSIMRKPPSAADISKFFQNLLGGKNQLIVKYSQNKISYETMKEAAKILLEDKKLLKQSFFNPYPEKLVMDAEDDRNREYWKID